jgi:hypothetical protein
MDSSDFIRPNRIGIDCKTDLCYNNYVMSLGGAGSAALFYGLCPENLSI